MNAETEEVVNEVRVLAEVDTHTHPRDKRIKGDGRMETLVPVLADEFETVVAIGNCKKPVIDVPSAREWRSDIDSCVPLGKSLDVRIAALVRDDTPASLIAEAYDIPGPAEIDVLKIFFTGVSNDYGNSVSHPGKIDALVRATYTGIKYRNRPMHVMIHCESKYDDSGNRIEMRDREWWAFKNYVEPLVRKHPDAHFTVAHVSDYRTLEGIYELASQGFNIWGEIGAHYMFQCHEDLYEGKGNKGTTFQAHKLCWPLYKAESSMHALQQAALSGVLCFHYGSDWACHADDPGKEAGVKITGDGEVCGGVAIWPTVGKSLIIDLFVKNGKQVELDRFMSLNARQKFGLPPPSFMHTYVRKDWEVPKVITGEGPSGPFKIRPFMRGEVCHWQRGKRVPLKVAA
jgi:dihydroorotase